MIRIIGIYRLREEPWQTLQREYLKRIAPYCHIECVPVKADAASEMKVRMKKEGESLFARIKPHDHAILLDAGGTQYTTSAFASRVRGFAESGENVTFLIGGAFGFSEEWKAHARETMSLSRMTLPHDMARIVLLEQIYRSITLWKGIPYHY